MVIYISLLFSGKAVTPIKTLKPYIQQFFQRADIFLLVICTICSIFGILMVDKAVVGMVNGGWNMSAPSKYIAVQVFSMFLGIGAFVVFTIIDADILGSQWKLLCAVNVLLLVALVMRGSASPASAFSRLRSSRFFISSWPQSR